ncbi:hypothetical protein P154DRAFT_565220 [Amniculicola lignicola CBS 123094]|uniref:DUF7703 domain-containing protein n=1 Tax=Amniculicola lignicola CBS 123094 TaxID=1392246 RepID=A0A6A5WA27_9PLEO|nr:hypothetical protein P154DRAFT_565220 [Amniculicola lignicola CBS 123094]
MFDNANCTGPGTGNGINGGNFDVYGADRRIPRSMTAFTAVAWYISIETLVLIFFVFKKYSGLYFWSLLITTLSVIPYATGAWMKQNSVSHHYRVTETLLTLGWVIMVPGQSMVLYSRLHLISTNWRLLRFIFCLIIASSILLCVPTVTLNLRQYTSNPAPYTRGYAVMEKIQMTLFTAQEVFISGVYFWEIRRVFMVIFDGKTRKIMWQLVAMNVLLLILDTALLIVEFENFYMIQTTFKSLVYSVKLKVEFGVLSQIVSVVQQKRSEPNSLTLAIPKDIEAGGEKCGAALEEVPSFDPEARFLQRNLPPEWRLSVGGGATVAPDLIEIQRCRMRSVCENDSPTWTMGSVDNMYPGRLG